MNIMEAVLLVIVILFVFYSYVAHKLSQRSHDEFVRSLEDDRDEWASFWDKIEEAENDER